MTIDQYVDSFTEWINACKSTDQLRIVRLAIRKMLVQDLFLNHDDGVIADIIESLVALTYVKESQLSVTGAPVAGVPKF